MQRKAAKKARQKQEREAKRQRAAAEAEAQRQVTPAGPSRAPSLCCALIRLTSLCVCAAAGPGKAAALCAANVAQLEEIARGQSRNGQPPKAPATLLPRPSAELVPCGARAGETAEECALPRRGSAAATTGGFQAEEAAEASAEGRGCSPRPAGRIGGGCTVDDGARRESSRRGTRLRPPHPLPISAPTIQWRLA